MHICFSTIDYHQDNKGGGIASYLDAIAPALIAMGHKVSIIGPGKVKSTKTDENGVRIIQQPLGNYHWYAYRLKFPSVFYLLWREWEWSWWLYKAIRELHRRDPIDILESHELGIWYLVRKRSKLPPIIVRLHGSPYIFRVFSGQKPSLGEKLLHWLELKWLKKIKGISAPGQFQAQYYEELLARKIERIANPVAPHFLAEGFSKKEPINPPQVLYTGRIEYRKGTLVLLKAFGLVIQRLPNVQLLIAGERHNSISEELLQQTITEAGIADNLCLLGHIPFKRLQEYYSTSNVFVMPSYYETFGISVIEAMAHGLPVVATKAGALPELVVHQENGLIIGAGDIKALADAIIYLLNHPAMAQEWGQKGKEMVEKQFIPGTIAEQLVSFYNTVKE